MAQIIAGTFVSGSCFGALIGPMAAHDHYIVVVSDKRVPLKILVKMVERSRAEALLQKGYHSLLLREKVLAV